MSTPLRYRSDPWGQTSAELATLGVTPGVTKWIERQNPLRRLWQVIPDDPNYRRHIPIEYRLDAKRIVGDLAQDLQSGKSAHLWVDLAHWGIAAAEMFALIEGLALAGPFLALAGNFLALGAPYQAAAEEIAKNYSATGYARGAVLGANQRSASLVRQYYGSLYFANSFEGRIQRANHNAGLIAGFLDGRKLNANRRQIFFRDLGRRMGDQSYRGPQSQWRPKDYQNWYDDTATAFRRYHLTA